MKPRSAGLAASTMVPLINRLSSGTKILIIMTVALMPLGLIALFASIQSANVKRLQHVAEARVLAAAEARQIDLVILRASNLLRLAANGASLQPERCAAYLAESRRAIGEDVRIGLFDADRRMLCSTPRFESSSLVPPRGAIGAKLALRDDSLRFTVRTVAGAIAVGDLPRPLLAAAIDVDDPRQGVALLQDRRRMPLVVPSSPRMFDRRITISAPLDDNQIALLATSVASSISAIEVLLVLLPLLMWAAAAIIGWIVVNELLLRPLAQLQRAVAAFGAEGTFVLPPSRHASARDPLARRGLCGRDRRDRARANRRWRRRSSIR